MKRLAAGQRAIMINFPSPSAPELVIEVDGDEGQERVLGVGHLVGSKVRRRQAWRCVTWR